MASPAPIAALCLLARQGWPLLVAALLALWLGWSALQEGRRVSGDATLSPSAAALDEHASGRAGELPPPEPLAPRIESGPEGSHGDSPPLLNRLCLLVPLSGPQTLRLPVRAAAAVRLAGRRQPPSHAPPALLS
ncbi:hypothetical protein [Stenotrophomonas sp. ZAC14A_NAIMI4_1]|uniref:hypothetical protein n=1 Tax=Stenotrophomonas sp. ZAC14A_NAIMI4_1 TaxID=2072412 RepID=UPI000D53F67B|nr:hypothetical protein [Stenotrophomonas sp. ZAC14A_NAIMI4_1]AWH46903.1 hypothetical protein C1926_18685 [Stenotrophomonas sp. ZAC14A_NAIMI4_1]